MRLLALAFLFVFVGAFTAWAAAALYFSHPDEPALAMGVAGGAGLAGIAVLAGLAISAWRRRAISAFIILGAPVVLWWSGIEPSNDRQWKPEVAVAPYATVDGDLVTMHNIRNFDYRSETDFTAGYYDKSFDMANLKGVDVVASYWMGLDIAHIFLSFDFGPDGHLAMSIERRDELGEGYSTVKGLFRQFELFYVVADERDVIRLRTNFRADPPEDVYVYRLQGPLESSRRLFLEYVHKINSLRDRPEFYNTLTTNCTSNIWMHTRVNPGHLHYSWKLLLSGHVPEYLYEQGKLDSSLSFPELRERSKINERARDAGVDDFSQRIRDGLPGIPNY